ncbi:hypothetical protein V6N11_075197 [Hibiscus sabdariffa]|uniref:Uncharacterized protein n=1 Tax=Hibiscus sabdariffa TaxID=183260 RepID=A0ABR2R5R7_9ROSI
MHLHGWYRKVWHIGPFSFRNQFQPKLVGDWCGGDVLRFSLTKKLVVTIVHQSFKASRLRRLPSFGDFM